ncbi:methyl-accepting chemotaxis protein [Paenibacillus sp. UNC499MF]|uniref:methyl-accepting chemotaxis protein n=1 Tax=Paenibacillus sp. UNC499MF TaxID=1502751 RepID=UPI00089FFF49|nr:methyl-accepting chemotaxis protein [Paenibacillus sp. UNC499MF]SEF43579.1 methyl-accepting chemotaxis protein [Paenibacillus sp. UNC499MF]
MNKKLTQTAAQLRERFQKKQAPSGGAPEPGRPGGGFLSSSMGLTNPAKSVGMKLFLIFIVSILFFVLTVGITSYQLSKSVVRDKVSEASKQTMIQASQKLDLLFGGFEDLTMQMMLDADLQRLLDIRNEVKEGTYEQLEVTRKITEKVNSYLFSNKSIKSLTLLKTDGQMINSNGASLNASTEEITKTDWFQAIAKTSGQPLWLDTKPKGYFSGEPAVAMGRYLNSTSTSTPIAMLLMEIPTSILEKELGLIQLGDNSTMYISDASNKLIYAKDQELLAKPSPVTISEEQQKTASGDFLSADKQTQNVYSKFAGTGWFLVGSMPVGELVKDANVIFNLTLVIALAAAVIAALIGIFVARMIGRPLAGLAGLMKQGAQGNLKVRANLKSQDEIGMLGENFDRMMEQITTLVRQTNESAQEVLNTASEVANASKITATSAKEIAVATDEISGGAAGLASESERGNELTHHIGEKMKQVMSANLEMGTAASGVRSSGEQGTKYMEELRDKTGQTEVMTRSMVEKVDNLKESTRSIRKILEMLHNLTKQTNILSLNATIEAARAGTAGRGFMVVADEIRKLADQSKQSIDVVAQITETIQREIDETVHVLHQAYPLFNQQIGAVKEADGIFAEVQNHMSQFIERLNAVTESISELDQSQAVLSDAMTNVSAVAEQSLATSEEVASLSSEQLSISQNLVKLSDKLENLSNSLKDTLSKFTL